LTVVLSPSADVGQYNYDVILTLSQEPLKQKTLSQTITVLQNNAVTIVATNIVANACIYETKIENTYSAQKDGAAISGGNWSIDPQIDHISVNQSGTVTYANTLEVGDYQFTLKYLHNDNYIVAESQINFTVSQKTVVITAEGGLTLTKNYNESKNKQFTHNHIASTGK
jgi:hypothetical protein